MGSGLAPIGWMLMPFMVLGFSCWRDRVGPDTVASGNSCASSRGVAPCSVALLPPTQPSPLPPKLTPWWGAQVCILSMGSDPTDLIMGLAKKKKKEVLSVSMGQGQEVVARRFCDQGVATGCWALLQNCHLGIKFLVELEQRLAAKDAEEIDPDFRVWITSEPHPSFPIGLLQMSIKITNEAPVGMKAGMKRSYAWITQVRDGWGVQRGVGSGGGGGETFGS
jgi:hypothetical protein